MEFTSAGAYELGSGVGNHQSLTGFAAARRNQDRVQRRKVLEAAKVYADVLQGRLDPVFLRQAMRPTDETLVQVLAERYPGLYGDPGGRMIGLKETMSVTDYQALYVDVLDRMYYGYYSAYPIVNKGLVKVHQLRDFRTVSRYMLDGVVTPLTSMDAAAPPPQRALDGPVPQGGASLPTASTAPVQYSPLLYQAMTSVNWRAMVNDDLGIFQDLANRLAIAGNRGISKFITTFYMDANGPNALLYKSGYGNQIVTANGAVTNNPALSIAGLQDAFNILAGMKDSGGDPILITGRVNLWYGPSLHATANNLMNQLNVYLTQAGGVAGSAQPGQFVNTNNWIVQNLNPVMDPYIPIVCTTSGVKNTSWGLTVDPNSQNRPNTEIGFLNGYETPQIFTKVPNTQRMGGGVDPTLGDFFTMDSDMKIVTVMGGVQIDGRSTVASNGSGS
jgi:hypothetical protein